LIEPDIVGSQMNEFPPPVWNDLSDDLCETVLSFCVDVGDGAPAACSVGLDPGSFRWYEQDTCDDFANEVFAWAWAAEAALTDRNA
jgi:hypothetical protein